GNGTPSGIAAIVAARGPARMALVRAAANHSLPAKGRSGLGDNGALALLDAVREVNDDPVARLSQAIGERTGREGGLERPAVAVAGHDATPFAAVLLARRQPARVGPHCQHGGTGGVAGNTDLPQLLPPTCSQCGRCP